MSALPAAAHWAVVAYLVGLPLALGPWFFGSAHNAARVAQLALTLVCAISTTAIARSAWGWQPSNRGVQLVAVILFVLAGVSITLSPVTSQALRELSVVLGLVAVAWASADLVRTNPAAGPMVCALSSLLYGCSVTVLAILIAPATTTYAPADLFVGYDNHRFFNHVQTVAIPLVITALAAGKTARLRAMAWAGAITCAALLLATGGRSTVVAIVVGVSCALLGFGRDAVPFVKRLGTAVIGGALLYVAVFVLLPTLHRQPIPGAQDYVLARLGSDQSRLMLWGVAIEHIRQSPWFGVGPMHFAHFPNGTAAHPHNMYLLLGAEWGLPVLFLVTIVAARALAKLLSAVRRSVVPVNRAVGVGLFVTWIAVAMDGMFSGNLVMPVSQVWIAFLAGWTWAWYSDSAHLAYAGIREPVRAVHARVLSWFLLFAQVWLWLNIWPEVADLGRHLEGVARDFPAMRTHPRFWSHGWF